MSNQTLTPAQANNEIRRFVNYHRESRTGESHAICCDHFGREYAELCGLMAAHDLTWVGGERPWIGSLGLGLGAPIGFCVWNREADETITFGHPTPEAAFDAALARVQAGMRDDRPNPHATVPKAATIAEHEAAVKALNPKTSADLAAAHAVMLAAEAAIKAGPGCTYDLMCAVEAARLRIGSVVSVPHAATPSATRGGHLDDVPPAQKPTRNHHTRRPWVYVCHPYSADPKESARVVTNICRTITAEGKLPIGPHVYLGAFVDDDTERATAMELCLNLLQGCGEMRVYGPTLSAGMREEIEFAMAHGIRFTSVTGPAYDTFTKHDAAEPKP